MALSTLHCVHSKGRLHGDGIEKETCRWVASPLLAMPLGGMLDDDPAIQPAGSPPCILPHIPLGALFWYPFGFRSSCTVPHRWT